MKLNKKEKKLNFRVTEETRRIMDDLVRQERMRTGDAVTLTDILEKSVRLYAAQNPA